MGKNIYLIGFMGAGKSTVSLELAKQTGMKLVEMDERIVNEQGMPITEIFAQYGEEHFRDLESALVRTIGEEGDTIVSCGGGAVLRKENVDCMKQSGRIVFLSATPETVYERVKDDTGRPILNGNMNVEFIEGLMAKRRPIYEAAADIKVDTDGLNPEEIGRRILSQI